MRPPPVLEAGRHSIPCLTLPVSQASSLLHKSGGSLEPAIEKQTKSRQAKQRVARDAGEPGSRSVGLS